jgi:hypothetical protein
MNYTDLYERLAERLERINPQIVIGKNEALVLGSEQPYKRAEIRAVAVECASLPPSPSVWCER